MDNGQMRQFTESLGMTSYVYKCGQYVKVKFYKNDINFLKPIDTRNVPLDIINTLNLQTWETVENEGYTPHNSTDTEKYDSSIEPWERQDKEMCCTEDNKPCLSWRDEENYIEHKR